MRFMYGCYYTCRTRSLRWRKGCKTWKKRALVDLMTSRGRQILCVSCVRRWLNMVRLIRNAFQSHTNLSSDHLFANWSSMQANKASDDTKKQLEEWLQNPDVKSGAVSKSAKADLNWLEGAKDLSSVSMDPEKQVKSLPDRPPSSKPTSTKAGGPAGGGFLALFGCASKRK